jgi:hypothetical protein
MIVTRTGSVGEITKLKTLSAASASADKVTVALTLRPPTSTGSNSIGAVPPGSSWTGFRPVLDAVDVERQRAAGDGLVRVIGEAGRDRHALLIGERRSRQRDAVTPTLT